jgi:CheY-specific phosphatase CheX
LPTPRCGPPRPRIGIEWPDAPFLRQTVVLGIKPATEGLLVLSFPDRTAAAITERVLADAKEEIDETLVRDCVGEIANVIAGQAKTLLAGTRLTN